MPRLRHFLMIVAAAWGLVLLPASTAMAAQTMLYCEQDGNGDPTGNVGGGEFFYTGDNQDAGACTYTGPGQVFPHVFSIVVCNFVVIINDVLGKFYCGMQFTLMKILSIVITLYIVVFGAQILMGMVRLTTSEILTRLLKIALVWTFVTQSSWGIGLAYNFFVDFAANGVRWALNSLSNSPADPTGIMPVYAVLDKLIFDAVFGPFTQANSKVIGFFAAMAVVVPPLFMMGLYWLWTTFTILARAVISFLMAISALAFLIALSPIFLSFMLFQVTNQFFENWLKYMISYTLQIVIVFACLAMWLSTVPMIIKVFDQISGVVWNYNKLPKYTTIVREDRSFGVCPYRVGRDAFGPTITCADSNFDPVGPPGCFNLQAYTQFVNDHIRRYGPAIPPPPPPGNVPCPQDVIDDLTDLIPIVNVRQNIGEEPFDPAGQPTNAVQNALNMLVYFIVYHLVTLIIIAYAFDALLKKAYELSIQLSGPQYVPKLGQGFGGVGYGVIRKGATPESGARGGSGLLDGIRSLPMGGSIPKAVMGFLGQTSKQLGNRRV